MDLNEARKVIWMQPLPRPAGELYDEGYLDQGRLEWAAKNASDPKVKQAAGILLAWFTRSGSNTVSGRQKIPVSIKPRLPDINVKMSIDQARATLWTWPPFKGQPMGPLVETRQLTIKDLGSAIEKVWDQRVKEAAIVLMAIRLNQTVNEPEPPKGYLRVVSKGRTFSERKQLQMVLLEGLIYGLSLGVALSYLFYSLFIQEQPKTTVTFGEIISNPLGIAALIFVICLTIGIPLSIGLVVEGSAKVLDKKVENYRKGQEGENRVDDVLNAALNGEWTLFRNVILPGRGGGDLDSVLVGPTGIWVLEIKTLSGIFRNIGDQWECRTQKKWHLLKKNPSQQARGNAARLGGFLEADGIKQWVKPAVVWANPESPLEIENPSVAIWKLDRLPDELGNISYGSKMSDDDRQKIIAKLNKLAERKNNKQNEKNNPRHS